MNHGSKFYLYLSHYTLTSEEKINLKKKILLPDNVESLCMNHDVRMTDLKLTSLLS